MAEFARRVGYSPTHIARLEQGSSAPTDEFIEKLCEIFGIDIEYFTGDLNLEEVLTGADLGLYRRGVFFFFFLWTSLEGEAFFRNSKINNLSIEYIGGNADFSYANIGKLIKLRTINGKANFRRANIGNMCNLQNINGTANFSYATIPSLNSLIYIGGHALFSHARISSAPMLEFVEGNVVLQASPLRKKLQNKDLHLKTYIRHLFVD